MARQWKEFTRLRILSYEPISDPGRQLPSTGQSKEIVADDMSLRQAKLISAAWFLFFFLFRFSSLVDQLFYFLPAVAPPGFFPIAMAIVDVGGSRLYLEAFSDCRTLHAGFLPGRTKCRLEDCSESTDIVWFNLLLVSIFSCYSGVKSQ